MKFVYFPIQMRLFKLSSHYQSLHPRGEQDPEFWKEITVAFVKKKYNIETLRNRYLISIYQGGPPHKPYFIAIDNQKQVIIGLTKKIVVTYMIGKFKVLIWFIWTWNLKRRYCYNQYLMSSA